MSRRLDSLGFGLRPVTIPPPFLAPNMMNRALPVSPNASGLVGGVGMHSHALNRLLEEVKYCSCSIGSNYRLDPTPHDAPTILLCFASLYRLPYHTGI